MAFNVDAELSDFWSLRVILCRGSTISQESFNRISQQLIEKFSSVSLSAVEKSLLSRQFNGTIPELLPNFITSTFQKSSLNTSSINLSFISDGRNTLSIEERDNVYIGRRVIAAVCIETFNEPSSTLYPVNAASSETSTYEQSTESISMLDSNEGTPAFVDAVSVLGQTLKEKLGTLYPSLKIFHVILLKENNNKQQSNELKSTNSTQTRDESISNVSELKYATIVSTDIWCLNSQDIESDEILRFPIHHFIYRLVLSALDAIKSLSSGSALDRDSDKPYRGLQRGPRSVLGKTKKRLGDLHLLIGLPLIALNHYHESAELFRSSGDVLWQAASIESEASAIRLYDLKYLEIDIAKSTATSKRDVSSGPSKQSGLQTSSDIPLPPEIENLPRDAPKRWAFGLLGAPTTQDTGSTHIGRDISPTKSGSVKINPILRHRDVIPGIRYNRNVTNRNLLIDLISSRMKEALHLYRTVGGEESDGLASECSLRYARFLSFLGERLACLDVLTRLCEDTKLRLPDMESVFLACSAICQSICASRHFAFYLVRAAFVQLEGCGKSHAARHLLSLASSWYGLAPFCLADWKPELRSNPESECLYPWGFNIGIDSLCTLARSVATLGRLTPGEWNFQVLNTFSVADFPFVSNTGMYQQESAAFLRRHGEKLMLNSKRIRCQQPHRVVWPTLQTKVLETLRCASDNCHNYELSIFLCFTILILLHPTLDPQMQKMILQQIRARASKLSYTLSTPPTLTLIPSASCSNHTKTRTRRHSTTSRVTGVQHESTTPSMRPSIESPVIVGGIGRGVCYSVPRLLELNVPDVNTHSRLLSTSIPSNTVQRQVIQSQNIDYSHRQQSPIEFIRQRYEKDKDIEPITASSSDNLDSSHVNELTREEYESKVFLFSPWRRKSEGVSTSTFQHVTFWVIDELQTVQVVFENPLNVDLRLDKVRAIAAGGRVEFYPVTILIPAASHSSPSNNRVTCDLNLLPKQPCELHLLGVRYSLSFVESVHLVLKDTNNLQSYFSTVANGVDKKEGNNELDVLKSSSIASVEVVTNVPHLVAKLEHRETSASDHQLDQSYPASSNIHIGASYNQSSVSQGVNAGLDLIPFTEGEERYYTLSLSSSSDIPCNYIQIVLLYDYSVSFEDWSRHIMSLQHPAMFFTENEDFPYGMFRVSLPSYTKADSSHAPLEFGDMSSTSPSCIASITPSFLSSTLCRQIEPITKTNRSISFQDVHLARGETIRIPIKCQAIKGFTESVALVRYFASSEAMYERYLVIPIYIDLTPVPEVFLDIQKLDILPFLPFNERDIIAAVVNHSGYSTELRQKLSAIYNLPMAIKLRGINDDEPTGGVEVTKKEFCSSFAHPMALLSLEVHNQSPLPVECCAQRDNCIPHIRVNSKTSVKWLIPIVRSTDNEDYSNSKSSTSNFTTMPPVVQSLVERLIWTHGRQTFPLQFSPKIERLSGERELAQKTRNGIEALEESLSKPQFSAEALRRLAPPLVSLHCRVSVDGFSSSVPSGKLCYQTATSTTIRLQVFIKFNISQNKSFVMQPSQWSIFVVPFEAIRSSCGELFRNNDQLTPVELFWAPSLECRTLLKPSPNDALVHEICLATVKPGIHTLYVGAFRHQSEEILWHHELIQLVVT